MRVRFRLGQGHPIQRKRGKNRKVASALGGLLIPASLMAYVLALWRLASDLSVTGDFPITGIFSHWQVWMALALASTLLGYILNRYGRGEELEMPRVPPLFPKRAARGRSGTD